MKRRLVHAVMLLALSSLAACAASSSSNSGDTGTAGAGGGPAGATGGATTGSGGATIGSGGTAGAPTAGSGGATPGTGGTTSGTGGSGGAAAGSGGTAGAAGAAGHAGSAGTAGAAGHGGAAGAAGSAGHGGAGGTTAATTCNIAGAATSTTPKLYVIGDSTASVYASDLYPRMGWAQPLQDDFAPACATVVDDALSGRSSKSFYDEGHWTPIKSALRAGDTVVIQFGHNDEKTDTTLHTDPFTTYEMYLSIYIDDTVSKGATPILATSINRNSWTNGVLDDTHGDYPVAMRQLAQAKNVELVDATALTKTYFTRIGQTATTALFMDLAAGQFPNYPNGNTDNTHLQEKGARTIAQLILADMYRQGFAIARLLKAVPQAP